jgi:hypothetical protein
MTSIFSSKKQCRCYSGKPFGECCGLLTELPHDASLETQRRFWGRYIDEVIQTMLASLQSNGALEDIRAQAQHDIRISDSERESNENYVIAIDAFALFHMQVPIPEEEPRRGSRKRKPRKSTRDEPPEVPLGALIAVGEGLFEESPHHDVFRELLRAPFSWYRVADVTPNETLTLQDLLLGEIVTVCDRLAARSIPKGCIVCAKVATFDTISLLVGALPEYIKPTLIPIVRETAEKLTSTIETELGTKLTPEILAQCAQLVLASFSQMLDLVSNPPPPILHNTDGDLMEPRLLEFAYQDATVQAMADSIVAAIKSLPDGPQPQVEKTDRCGYPTRIAIPYVRKSLGASLIDTVVIAHITVERKKISVEVNSAQRAADITKLMESLNKGVQFVMERPVLLAEPTESKAGTITPDNLPPEIKAALEAKLKQYQEQWLTSPVPALNGMTPIDASRCTAMRPVLEALLDDFAIREKASKSTGLNTFDVAELRARLGFDNRLN